MTKKSRLSPEAVIKAAISALENNPSELNCIAISLGQLTKNQLLAMETSHNGLIRHIAVVAVKKRIFSCIRGYC